MYMYYRDRYYTIMCPRIRFAFKRKKRDKSTWGAVGF